MNTLQEENAALEGDATQAAILQRRIDAQKQRVQDLAEANKDLRKERNALAAQRDATVDGTEFLMRQFDTLNDERETLRSERDELLEEVKRVRATGTASRRLGEIDQMCATAINSAKQARRDNLHLIERKSSRG